MAGVVLFIAGQFFGSLNGALSKSLAPELPVLMIVWGRFVGFLLLVIGPALQRHGMAAVAPARPVLHVARGLLLVGATIGFVGAVSGMPLADAIALIFIYPFLVTALAPLLLGERVALSSWVAVICGFVGVLVVMRPTFDGIDPHALFAIGGGTCFGLHLMVTRGLTASSPPLVTMTTSAIVGAVLLTAALPFIWQTPTAGQWLVLAEIALASTLAQILTTLACNRAGMALLAPFGYCEIVWATVLGLAMFGDFPDTLTWLGIAIIVASGVYIALAANGRRLPLVSRTRPPAA